MQTGRYADKVRSTGSQQSNANQKEAGSRPFPLCPHKEPSVLLRDGEHPGSDREANKLQWFSLCKSGLCTEIPEGTIKVLAKESKLDCEIQKCNLGSVADLEEMEEAR